MFVNKTPRFYKVAADYVKKIQENGASIKQLIYSKQHPNIMGLYALVNEVFKHFEQIKFLITHAKLETITTKNPWLIYVLITELLWGKKHLPDIKSTTFVTILLHKQKLEKLLPFAEKSVPTTEKTVNTPKYVRVNTLKVCVSDAIAAFIEEGYNYKKCKNNDYQTFLSEASSLQEYDFMSDIHFDELLLFHPSCKFFDHKAYQSGLIILQDKASCIPAYLLNPPPGSVVLDACAAPGTKTTLLASLMKNEGTLYAVDRNQSRFQELKLFVEKSGASCVRTVHKDLLNLNGSDFPNVQYILVDPSCSGSGMLDRIGETSVENERLKKLQGFQILLLKHCMRHFHNAKRVVYSTCSIHPEENEEVVKDILSSTYNFKLMSAKNLLKGPWLNFGSSKYGNIGKNCLYSRPEKDLTNGFFVAVFEKVSDEEVNPYYRNNNKNLYNQIEENDIRVLKTQEESETNLSNLGELSNRKKSNFQSVLRKKKRSTKKVKREIVVRANVEKLNPHVVYDDNFGNEAKKVSDATKRISKITSDRNNDNSNRNVEFIIQNPLESIKKEEHLNKIKKKRKRDDREYNIKKIKKQFKEMQPSGYIDEKEERDECVLNINQSNSKLKTKKKKKEIIDSDINRVDGNAVLLDMNKVAIQKYEHPETYIVNEKSNFIEAQKKELKICADQEWTNGAKAKSTNSGCITIDALKVSSEKEKLKNRLLKKTFTYLNQNEYTDLEMCTNSNSSILNHNENKLEKKPNKSAHDGLEDRLMIEYENKNNVKYLEGTINKKNDKEKKSHKKKCKTTMIPFRGIIENNITLIKSTDKLDSNEDYEENSIKLDVKNNYSGCKKSKKGHSNNKLNGSIGVEKAGMGDSKLSTISNSENSSINIYVKDTEECESDIGIKDSKKKSKRKNCDTSILDEIVAIVKN
ncbi:uncharacterized protein LOC108732484 [Agrilus planipennis]|uniref:Uncharacterized protein LOC108732484 n=1 Tax=Agrilus planipennis TaxID=224129 RepID=A0A1W4W3W0_AGRPL|nr:uncharacterized protein LOC108732484 [Agrilus planipennis]